MSYYRCASPFSYLSSLGFDVLITNRLSLPLEQCDLLILQRQHADGVLQIAEDYKSKGGKIIYELDDNFHTIPPNNPAGKLYPKDGKELKNIEKFLKMVDIMTVSTPGLASFYKRYAANIRICRNVVNPEAFGSFVVPERLTDEFRLGWAGSGTHHDDFDTVIKPITDLMRERQNIRFVFLGMDYKNLFPVDVRRRMEFVGHTFPIGNDGRPLFHAETGDSPVHDYYKLLKKANFHAAIAPLLGHPFNSSKCLDADTMITTSRGVIQISKIVKGDKVFHDGKWVKVEDTSLEPSRMGLKITTKDGYQIKATPEHRLVLHDGTFQHVSNLKIGDVLKTEPESIDVSEYVVLPWPADSRKSRVRENEWDFLNATDGPTITINQRWGRFLGAFLGDGSFSGYGSVYIHCDGQDDDWIEVIKNDFEAFGFPSVATNHAKTFDGTVLRKQYVGVHSAHLVRFLLSIGVGKMRENGLPLRYIRVPECIWLSPKNVIEQFLMGIFETDGTNTGSGVQVTMKSYEFGKDIQKLLLLVGIESRLHCEWQAARKNDIKRPYWHVTLRRDAADLFSKNIGFGSIRKKQKLFKTTSKSHSNNYKPMQWRQEIISIDECEIKPVDIQVEGELFAAAGFVSHNSAIKLIEYGSSGIPFIATNFGPYKEYCEGNISTSIAPSNLGRNEPCFCGSGKKYKKCHLAPNQTSNTSVKVGELALADSEWKNLIRKMMDDDSYRIALAENNYQNVLENHTIQKKHSQWLDVLAELGLKPSGIKGSYIERIYPG